MPGIKVNPERADGRMEVVFSQSWLNTFMECPEQARLEMVGQMPKSSSDATAIGTAVHAGIEAVLLNKGDPLEAATQAFEAEVMQPHFRWVQTKTLATAHQHIAMALDAWHATIFPQLSAVRSIEEKFRLFLCSGETAGKPWVAYVEGAWDAEFDDGLWDWKTANDERKYKGGFGGEGWKLKRWAIQPTVYTLAKATRDDCFDSQPFTFGAMVKGTSMAQTLEVQRGPDEWAWLRVQVGSIMALITANLPQWPLNDQHALCSGKFCPVWDSCKGKHVTLP